MDDEENHSMFKKTRSFTESLEASEFHEGVICFTFFNNFCRCLCLRDHRIAQKSAEQGS